MRRRRRARRGRTVPRSARPPDHQCRLAPERRWRRDAPPGRQRRPARMDSTAEGAAAQARCRDLHDRAAQGSAQSERHRRGLFATSARVLPAERINLRILSLKKPRPTWRSRRRAPPSSTATTRRNTHQRVCRWRCTVVSLPVRAVLRPPATQRAKLHSSESAAATRQGSESRSGAPRREPRR
jgi:hypothetical protein